MKTKKRPLRTLSVLLTVAVLFGVFVCLPVGAEEILTEGDYTYTVENGEATITGYNGNGSNIVIPSMLGGKQVTVIGQSSFENCSSLVNVKIPYGVKEIKECAFNSCPNLKNVDIPTSVTKLGGAVFGLCTSLTSMVIPSSVKKTGSEIFYGCSSLTSVVLPEGLEEIQGQFFGGCSSLKSVNIPSTVKRIIFYAFQDCTSLTEIVIPDGVISLGSGIFYGSAITHIEIPASVTSIGIGTFGKCNRLTDIFCLASEEPQGWDNGWLGDCTAKVHWGTKMPVIHTILGDPSGDGKVNANDYMMLKRHVLHTFKLTADQIAVVDINKDGKVNATDYMLLKRAVLGTYKLAAK